MVWCRPIRKACSGIARRPWRPSSTSSGSSQQTSRPSRCRTPIPIISAMSRCFPPPCSTCRRPNMSGPAPMASRASSRSIPSPSWKAIMIVFGDGSVIILSTPGHTPGHQSLLVKLPKTGALILSGDAVHFKSNWDNRRRPFHQFQQGADAGFHAKDIGHHDEGKRAVLDQSRQAPARDAQNVACVLRLSDGVSEGFFRRPLLELGKDRQGKGDSVAVFLRASRFTASSRISGGRRSVSGSVRRSSRFSLAEINFGI